MRLGHKNRVGAEVRSRAQSDGGKASKRVCILVYPAPETSIRKTYMLVIPPATLNGHTIRG